MRDKLVGGKQLDFCINFFDAIILVYYFTLLLFYLYKIILTRYKPSWNKKVIVIHHMINIF